MGIVAKQIIGHQLSGSGNKKFQAFNPSTNEAMDHSFPDATPEEIENAFALAEIARIPYAEVTRSKRADFLDSIAEEIMALGDELVDRATAETGLPTARIQGERGRTVNQLKLFATVVREGDFLEASIDTAIPDRQPIPKPDIRMINIPMGTVAVFGASNFPLAFSVAGGDTASALAAGCPVIVKAHPTHPGTSDLVGCAIQKAAESAGMPEGVFSMLQGSGFDVGQAMVKHPFTKAVAFTGSFNGGKALFDLAAQRDEPIPCFAEMGSINPVFLLPEQLDNGAKELAGQYVGSVNLGVGQFCTNPGLVLGIKGKALDQFMKSASEAISDSDSGTMLHVGIKRNYEQKLREITSQNGISKLAQGKEGEGTKARSSLLTVSGKDFINNEKFQDEIFGPASIIVMCDNMDEMTTIAGKMKGNLTATLQATENDMANAANLVRILEQKVGRILVNGFPTGVEVCYSMVHGGPFPATTDGRFTSVGTSAIKRFLRPVSYQNFPQSQLPEELQNANKTGIWRRIDGKLKKESIQ